MSALSSASQPPSIASSLFHSAAQPSTFKLSEVISELLDLYELLIKMSGVRLVRRLDSSATMFGSRSEIRQTVSNLLINALWLPIPAAGLIRSTASASLNRSLLPKGKEEQGWACG